MLVDYLLRFGLYMHLQAIIYVCVGYGVLAQVFALFGGV